MLTPVCLASLGICWDVIGTTQPLEAKGWEKGLCTILKMERRAFRAPCSRKRSKGGVDKFTVAFATWCPPDVSDWNSHQPVLLEANGSYSSKCLEGTRLAKAGL